MAVEKNNESIVQISTFPIEWIKITQDLFEFCPDKQIEEYCTVGCVCDFIHVYLKKRFDICAKEDLNDHDMLSSCCITDFTRKSITTLSGSIGKI